MRTRPEIRGKSIPWPAAAAGLFLAAFGLRMLLHTLLIAAPTIGIDESLYTNIARSLAAGHGVLYREQPIDYPYLCYPLLLVPVYRLQAWLGGDVYRWVQGFNTLAMTSSVIPVFLLGKGLTGDGRKAFLGALITALMPDMVMGGYEMTEAVLWPMALWLLVFAWGVFRGERPLANGLAAAGLAALMYWTKPGAVALGAVLLLCALVRGLRQGRRLLPTLLPLVLLAVLAAGLTVLGKQLTGVPGAAVGLYEKQWMSWKPADILVAGEGAVMTVFLFAVAAGGVCAVVPLLARRRLDGDRQAFLLAFYAALGALILGTAVFVVPYDWTGALGKLPLHLRYCAFCIPVCFLFFQASEGLEVRREGLMAALGALLVLVIFPGVSVGWIQGFSASVDAPGLSAFFPSREVGPVIPLVMTALMAAFLLGMLIAVARGGWRPGLQRLSTVFLAVFLLINGVTACRNADAHVERAVWEDAAEMDRLMGTEPCLGITHRHYDDIASYGLESRLNAPMQQVTVDQLFVSLLETEGVYVPFVPVDQPPNVHCGLTPDTGRFLLGDTIPDLLELGSGVQTVYTTHGRYALATVPPGERLVDTMLYGVDKHSLQAGTKGYLAVFDPGRNLDGMIHLQLTASGSGSLTLGEQTIRLTPEQKTYDLLIPYNRLTPLGLQEGSARIWGYATEKRE